MSGITHQTVSGVEYTCADHRAIASRWVRDEEQRVDVDIQEEIVVGQDKFTVDMFLPEMFAKANICRVSIPKSVKSLSDKCFEFCEKLVDICFAPESTVAVFGKCCFKGCGFSEFCIPDSVRVIEDNWFDRCSNLSRVIIQDTSLLMKAGVAVFRGCKVVDLFLPKLLDITESELFFLGVKSFVTDSPRFFRVSGDNILSLDGTRLVACFSSESVFNVPDSIVVINRGCFVQSQVRNIIFGKFSRIKQLDGAFQYSMVESIRFNAIMRSKLKVDGSAYPKDIWYLTNGSVLLSSGGSSWRLMSLLGPEDKYTVPWHASEICSEFCTHPDSFSHLDFEDGLEVVSIAPAAFRGTQIKTLHLARIEAVSVKCFQKCHELRSLSFASNCNVLKLESKAFQYCGIEQVTIPSSVRSIGVKCFCGCTSLKEVTFSPNSCLHYIGDKAFMNTALQQLLVPKNVKDVTGTSFYGISTVVLEDNGFLAMKDGFLVREFDRCLISVMRPGLQSVTIPSYVRVLNSKRSH